MILICLECEDEHVFTADMSSEYCPSCGARYAMDLAISCDGCGGTGPISKMERTGIRKRQYLCAGCFEERLVSARELISSHRSLCLQGL